MPDATRPDRSRHGDAVFGGAPGGPDATGTDFAARRVTMVDTQVRPADVTKFPIIEAMLHVRREAFVPPARREAAYLGENLHLGGGRVMLDPRTLAKLLDGLDVQPGERVLDLGCGLGYAPAVLARMGARVLGVEDDPARAEAAALALAAEGVEGAVVLAGPLAAGAPDDAPFDVVLIEGAVETVPDAILAQVAPGGRIGAIMADGALGTARIGRESGGRVHWRSLFHAGAPLLPGFARAAAFIL